MNIDQFISIISTTPSADNSQPWLVSNDGQNLSIRYFHRSNTPDPFGTFGHATLISGGALQETIDTLLQLGGQPTSQSIVRTSEKTWILDIPTSAILLTNPDSDYSRITLRHTNRHPFKPFGGAIPTLPSVEQDCKVSVITRPSDISILASCLKSCCEARFNNQELHEWLFSSLRWTEDEAGSGSGLDVSTLHLPPGGRFFMHGIAPWERMKFLNKLGLYKLMALADTMPFRSAPAIMAFIGKTNWKDIWDTGKCMQRTWISLNQQGFSVHPYYAITDLGNRLKNGELHPHWVEPVKNAQEDIRNLLSLNHDEELHMLFRVGMSKTIPVRSRRLPTNAFFESAQSIFDENTE